MWIFLIKTLLTVSYSFFEYTYRVAADNTLASLEKQ